MKQHQNSHYKVYDLTMDLMIHVLMKSIGIKFIYFNFLYGINIFY